MISISFSLFVSIGQCQQFEALYDYNGFSNDGGSIVKINDGYFCTHLATDPEFMDYTVLMSKFNESGETLWDTTLTNSQTEYFEPGWYQSILPTESDNDKWILGNSYDALNELYTPFLLRTSVDGELQQINFLDTLYDLIPQILNPTIFSGVVANSGMYLIGTHAVNSTIYFLLIRCDLEGNFEWHQAYSTSWTIIPQCVTDVGDGIVLGAKRFNPGDPSDSERYIRKFDYSGTTLWTRTYSAPQEPNLGAVSITKLDNGNYLFAGTKFIDNVSIQPLIGELDAATGDTLWTRLYFESEEYDPNNLADFNSINRIHGFKKLSDGCYLGVGECRHDIIPDSAQGPLDNAAFMMKLDSEYNLLWKRVYVPEGYAELDASPAQCQLNDFVENDDGSITALGRVYMYTGTGPQGGYIQDSYLIKVDSLGCLVSGCDVGITEYENLETILVYPNPTSELINIEFPNTAKWSISIFDMQGKLMNSIITPQCKKFSMEMQTLPAGIYTVVCSYSGDKIFTQRIIKQ